MDNLVSILKMPALNLDVKNAILRHVQNWSVAFEGKPSLGYVGQVYKTLGQEGVYSSLIRSRYTHVVRGHKAISSHRKTSRLPILLWSIPKQHRNGLTRMYACAVELLSHSQTGNTTVVTAVKCLIRRVHRKQCPSLTLVSPKKFVCAMVATRSSRRRPKEGESALNTLIAAAH